MKKLTKYTLSLACIFQVLSGAYGMDDSDTLDESPGPARGSAAAASSSAGAVSQSLATSIASILAPFSLWGEDIIWTNDPEGPGIPKFYMFNDPRFGPQPQNHTIKDHSISSNQG